MSPSSVHPLHVLIIEDDVGIGDMLTLLLEGDGYRVTWHTSAAAALAFLAPLTGEPAALRAHADGQPDAILLDLALDSTSGVALMQQVAQRRFPVPPVVVMSAGDERALAAARITLDAIGMLHKPFAPDALLSLLAQVAAAPPSDHQPDGDTPASPDT